MKLNQPLLWLVLCSACTHAAATDWWNPLNPADFAQERQVSAYAHGVAASTFVPLRNAANDRWDGYTPAAGNNFELVTARIGVNASQGGWNVGALYRQDWFAQVHRDTLDLYLSQKPGYALPANTAYTVDYALQGFEARGISLGKSFRVQESGHVVKWGVNATLLDAQRLKIQQASGTGATDATSAVTLTGNTFNDDTTTNTTTQTFNTGLRNQTPTGSGYSVDVGLHYESASGVQVQWTVTDAFSEIAWQQVPEVTLAGTSTFNGSFPGGRKVLLNFVQTLTPKHSLSVSVPFNGFAVEVSDNVQGPMSIVSLGLQHRAWRGVEVTYDYDFTFHTVGIALRHAAFALALRADTLNLDAAKALMLSAGVRYAF
jgi:hypothetical protein